MCNLHPPHCRVGPSGLANVSYILGVGDGGCLQKSWISFTCSSGAGGRSRGIRLVLCFRPPPVSHLCESVLCVCLCVHVYICVAVFLLACVCPSLFVSLLPVSAMCLCICLDVAFVLGLSASGLFICLYLCAYWLVCLCL